MSVQAETVLLQERNGTETETGEEERKQRKTESKSRIEQEEILEESQVDIDALAKELKKLEGEYPCPDFSRIFSYLFSFRFKEAGKEAGEWLLHALTFEFSSSRVLVGQLIGVVLFAAVFSNLSSAFRRFSIGDSGFLISYFISFTIIFANFNLTGRFIQKYGNPFVPGTQASDSGLYAGGDPDGKSYGGDCFL